MLEEMTYTVTTNKSFDEVLAAVQAKAAEKGSRVLQIHNIQSTLAEKGLALEPYASVEICNAGFAHRALGAEKRVGLLMPCQVNVHVQDGQVYLSTLLPGALARHFPAQELQPLAAEVDRALKAIADGAR